jgi:dihydroorotase (EC 3.5.2.3)
VVRLYSHRPARLLGVETEETFVVVKLEEFKVRGEDFAGKCRHTPFEGFTAFGRVAATAARGRIYFRGGEVYSL